MKSTLLINNEILDFEKEKELLFKQISDIQHKIEIRKEEIKDIPFILDLTNEEHVKMVLNPYFIELYNKQLVKALKAHNLSFEGDFIQISSEKRILKSTSIVLINLVKSKAIILVKIKNDSFIIKLNDDLKIGLFKLEENGDKSTIKAFFSIKQTLDYLKLI